MRARLAALGVEGVEARTFHSAALAQLHRFAPDAVGRILPTKALAPAADRERAARRRIKFRPAGDLATEIEWAKNRRLDAATLPRARSATTSRRSRPT